MRWHSLDNLSEREIAASSGRMFPGGPFDLGETSPEGSAFTSFEADLLRSQARLGISVRLKQAPSDRSGLSGLTVTDYPCDSYSDERCSATERNVSFRDDDSGEEPLMPPGGCATTDESIPT